MNTEQERAEFEAWANGRCELHLVNPAGRYSSAITQFAWEAYRAARAALQSQHDEETKRLRDALWIAERKLDALQSQDREDGGDLDDVEVRIKVLDERGNIVYEAIDHARRAEGDGE